MSAAAAGRTAARLLAEAGPARWHLAVTAAAGLAGTGLMLAQAWLLAHVLATAAAGAAAAALRWSLAGLLAVLAARAAAAAAAEVTALRAAVIVQQRLRSALARHCLRLGPAWLGRQRPGEITTLATSGLDSLGPYFSRYLPQVGLAVTVPVAVLATVTSADWISGVIIAVTLPLVPVLAALVGQRTAALTRRNWRLLARLGGHFLDVVQGLPTLRAFGRTAVQERVIGEVTDRYRRGVMSTLRVAFLSALVLELSAALATALVAVEVGLRLLYGHLGYSTALLVLLLTPEAYLPLRNASAQFHASADGRAAAVRAFDVLGTAAPGDHGPRRAAPVPDMRSSPITFNRVSVGYPGRTAPVLRGVDLTIRPGEFVTVAGENGAGKSTLLSVLLRFTEPVGGLVLAGGTDLAAIPAGRWRSQLGWLPQRPALFGWSVAENIALARPDAPRRDIERAAAQAGAAAFIEALPDGYDTMLGEGALRLSAGQRQLIALARLFLRDAPLMLLDEPTAHLDQASAAAIAEAVARLAPGRTIVVVSHRDRRAWPGAGKVLTVAGGTVTEESPDAPAIGARTSADTAVRA